MVVTAYQGKVLLTGQSPSADLASRAKQIAMGVDGATEVYNEIRTGQKVSLGTSSSDTGSPPKSARSCWTRSGEIVQRESDHREWGSVPARPVTQQEATAAADIASRVSA